MPKRVIILGSTGSIGCSALSVADNLPDEFEIVGLAAESRWQRIAEQVERYHPKAVVLSDPISAENLTERLCEVGSDTVVWSGADALVRLVEEVECDFVLAGIVGVAGLPATLAAVRRGLTVGLANKESLVVAGELMVRAAANSKARLLPVDSEHSAIYQSLLSGRHEEIERLYLTASGGPFRTWTAEQMRSAAPADAMRHPTWSMGPKISIDSATMMNKALEIIEAKWLFGVDPDRIEVVVHPESIIHSMVAFRDGSIVAQMGRPDMRTPIQYAMTHPQRLTGCGERLEFTQLQRMHFEPPDPARFPSLRLGHEVARLGGTAGAALNAANEAAVDAFRNERIGFLEIVPMVEDVVKSHLSADQPSGFEAHPDLTTLMAVDAWARRAIAQCCTV
jgi:1-deoxy-D-xylulose-5-phosphate reductoisomerase